PPPARPRRLVPPLARQRARRVPLRLRPRLAAVRPSRQAPRVPGAPDLAGGRGEPPLPRPRAPPPGRRRPGPVPPRGDGGRRRGRVVPPPGPRGTPPRGPHQARARHGLRDRRLRGGPRSRWRPGRPGPRAASVRLARAVRPRRRAWRVLRLPDARRLGDPRRRRWPVAGGHRHDRHSHWSQGHERPLGPPGVLHAALPGLAASAPRRAPGRDRRARDRADHRRLGRAPLLLPARLDPAPPPGTLRVPGSDRVAPAPRPRAGPRSLEAGDEGPPDDGSRAPPRVGRRGRGILRSGPGVSPRPARRPRPRGAEEAVVGPDRSADRAALARRPRRGASRLPTVLRGPLALRAAIPDRRPARRDLHHRARRPPPPARSRPRPPPLHP